MNYTLLKIFEEKPKEKKMRAKKPAPKPKKGSRRKWTKEELEYLLNNHEKKTVKEMAIELNREYGSTYHLLWRMYKRGDIPAISKPADRRTVWTDEMEDFLRNNFYAMSISELAERLDVDEEQIRSKLRHLAEKGVIDRKKITILWQEEEDQVIIDALGKRTAKEVAKELNRTLLAVKQRASILRREGLATGFFKRG